MPDLPTGDDASSTAPPGGAPPGAVPSGGAQGAETAGLPPPTGAPGAVDGSVPNQGLEAMGMEVMRKAMAAIHIGRSLLNPYSEEGKAADTMFRHGAKHFKPDMDSAKPGGPQLAQGGQPQAGPPQMAQAPPPAQPPTGPIPSLAAGGATG